MQNSKADNDLKYFSSIQQELIKTQTIIYNNFINNTISFFQLFVGIDEI